MAAASLRHRSFRPSALGAGPVTVGTDAGLRRVLSKSTPQTSRSRQRQPCRRTREERHGRTADRDERTRRPSDIDSHDRAGGGPCIRAPADHAVSAVFVRRLGISVRRVGVTLSVGRSRIRDPDRAIAIGIERNTYADRHADPGPDHRLRLIGSRLSGQIPGRVDGRGSRSEIRPRRDHVRRLSMDRDGPPRCRWNEPGGVRSCEREKRVQRGGMGRHRDRRTSRVAPGWMRPRRCRRHGRQGCLFLLADWDRALRVGRAVRSDRVDHPVARAIRFEDERLHDLDPAGLGRSGRVRTGRP